MSENRSDALFFKAFEMSEKYDYFVTSVISAVAAYSIQNLPKGSLATPSFDIYIIGLLVLLGTMGIAFKYLEEINKCRHTNALLLHAAETRGKLRQAVASGGQSFHNEETGDIISVETAMKQIKSL